MATKSILKNVTIKDKKNAERFVLALEQAEKNKVKECIELKVVVASVDDIRKMFNIG